MTRSISLLVLVGMVVARGMLGAPITQVAHVQPMGAASLPLPRVVPVAPNPVAVAVDPPAHRVAVISWGLLQPSDLSPYPAVPLGPGTLTLIDQVSAQVITRTQVLTGPRLLFDDPRHAHLLVAGGPIDSAYAALRPGNFTREPYSYPGYASVLDARDGHLLATVSLDGQPIDGVFLPTLARAFLLTVTGQVAVIDTGSGHLDALLPLPPSQNRVFLGATLASDPQRGRAYIAYGTDLYAFRRGATGAWSMARLTTASAVTGDPALPIAYLHATFGPMAVEPRSGLLLAAATSTTYKPGASGRNLYALDPVTGRIRHVVPLARLTDTPAAVLVDADGQRAIVVQSSLRFGGSETGGYGAGSGCPIVRVDLRQWTTNHIPDDKLTPSVRYCGQQQTSGIADATRHRLLMWGLDFYAMGPDKPERPGRVSVFDPRRSGAGPGVVATLDVPGGLGGVALDDHLGVVYLANRALASLSMVSAATLRLPALPQPPNMVNGIPEPPTATAVPGLPTPTATATPTPLPTIPLIPTPAAWATPRS